MWTSYSLLTDTYKLKYSIDYITTSTCYIGKSVNNVDPSKTIQQKLKQKTNPKLHLDEYYKPPRITTIFPMT